MNITEVLLTLLLLSNLSVFATSNPTLFENRHQADTIDLDALLTYSELELDTIVNNYYSNLEIPDTFDLLGHIEKLSIGDYYDMINFDSLIQSIDWNKATSKINWNEAFSNFDWNGMLTAICSSKDSSFGSASLGIDISKDSLLNASYFQSTEQLNECMNLNTNKENLRRALNSTCLKKIMFKPIHEDDQGRTNMDLLMSLSNNSDPDNSDQLKLLCAITPCLDANSLYKDFDWNCMFKNFDFNLIMQNWKLDKWIKSMDTIKLNQSNNVVKSQIENNPIMGIINPDSILKHVEVAFEDFFDSKSILKINQNFYDRIIGDNWKPKNAGNLRNILEFATPLWPKFYGDNSGTRYLLSSLWHFYEMQLAYSNLDYETALNKQLVLKDIIIQIIKKNLLNNFKKDHTLPTFYSENMIWSMLVSVEQFIGNSYSELGKHTNSLRHFKNALKINESIIIDINPIDIENTYLQYTFTKKRRESLLRQFDIDTSTLYESLEKLLQVQHPRLVEKHIKKGNYKDAITTYQLLKDLLFQVGENDEVIPSYQLPNPAASKPYELIFTRLIYRMMSKVMKQGEMTSNPAYEVYRSAPEKLDQFQRYQLTTFLHNNLGAYYFQLKNFELSQNHLLQAWERLKKLKKLDFVISTRPGYGSIETSYLNKVSSYVGVVANICQIHIEQKNYDKALTILKEAIDHTKSIRTTPKTSSPIITIEENLFEIYAIFAQVYLLKNNPPEAWNYLSNCRDIAKSSKYTGRKLQSSIHIGHYYSKISKPDSALIHWKVSQKIALESNDVNILSSLHGLLAQSHFQLNNYKLALSHLDSCETIAKKRSQYSVLNYLYSLRGQHYLDLKNYDKSLLNFDKGVEIIQDSLLHFTLAENSRQLILENSFSAYEGAIVSALHLNQKEKAFQYLQKSKARTLNELLISAPLISRKIPKELNSRKRGIISQLNKLQNKLLQQPDSIHFVSQQNDLIHQLRILNAQIRTRLPKYEEINKIKSLPTSAIQEKLDSNELFIDYFFGKSVYAFAIGKNKFQVFDLGSAIGIQQQLSKFTSRIDSINSFVVNDILVMTGLEKEIRNTTEYLYSKLIQPIKKQGALNNCDKLTIAPDKDLFLFPFELFQQPLSNKQFCLSTTMKIAYSPSASTYFYFSKSNHEQKEFQKQLLVISKSMFNEYPNLNNLNAHNPSIFGIEASNIDFVTGETTTRKTIEAKNLEKYKYIYISTHAKINSIPELSFLALTNSQLSLHNIADLNINSDMVVLSACQTAQGSFQRGAGIMGFARGFMKAGAKSLILSLWSVEDSATNYFFQIFFNELNRGRAPESALRNTKIKMMNSKEYNHPFYWSAFVLFN